MLDELAMRSNLLKRYHKKHSKAIVNSAQDEVFKKYFKATSNTDKKRFKEQIDNLSLNVQKKFHVDEMCLIDKSGQEISRVVFKEIAPESDLSPDEGSAPFFKPSLAQQPKKVFIQEPYMSADSLRWVICYTTPIAFDDGSIPGFYHFEMPLYAMQDAVNKGAGRSDDNYLLIVDKKGYVISDSRKKFKLELKVEGGQKEGNAVTSSTIKKYFPAFADDELGGIAKDIKSGKDGSGSFSDSGIDFLVAYKTTGRFGWSLVLVNSK